MAYRTGVSTSRGLSSLADHVGVSPVPLFDRVLRGGAALEIGCGEGRALLELQQRHPATRCVCLNYAGWKGGWGQGVGGGAQASADAATLRGMGAHYGLSLAADARLPDVRYGDWHNLTGFDDDSAYSLVYSQNALNEGKMHYPRRELAPLFTSVARMLRPGGVALLHLFGCCPANDTTVYTYNHGRETINDNASATPVARAVGRRGRKLERLRRPFGADSSVRVLDLAIGPTPPPTTAGGGGPPGCLAAAFVGFNFTTTMLLGRTAGGALPCRATLLPAALDLGALAPLLSRTTALPAARLVRFGYRDAVAPAAPPPSPAGCGGGAVESPLARRIKRLFKKKRGRGAKAAEPPKPPSCREQLARKKASKRAQQEAGEGPVFRQAYLDAVGAWMDAATG